MARTLGSPHDTIWRLLDKIDRRLRSLETAKPQSNSVDGPRSDLPGGVGKRVQWGLLTDGSYGIERWTSSGTRQTPTWS